MDLNLKMASLKLKLSKLFKDVIVINGNMYRM